MLRHHDDHSRGGLDIAWWGTGSEGCLSAGRGETSETAGEGQLVSLQEGLDDSELLEICVWLGGCRGAIRGNRSTRQRAGDLHQRCGCRAWHPGNRRDGC